MAELTRVTFWILAALAIAITTGRESLAEDNGSPIESAAEAIQDDLDDIQADRLPLGVAPEGDKTWSWLTDNLRWAFDLAVRIDVDTKTGDLSHLEFFGVDIHKVVSTEHRDIGTLLVQLYGKGKDNDWKYTTRLLYFNYFASGGGGFNIRIGHILVPFGLNLPSRTPGTLRQFIAPKTVGFKADWGASVNGVLPDWNYEIALTRGSGVDFKSRDGPFLVAARVGTTFDRPLVLGLSALYGKILKGSRSVARSRIGFDLRWQAGPIDVLGEFSYGKNDRTAKEIDSFVELMWLTPLETIMLYVQGRAFANDAEDRWTGTYYFTAGSRLHIFGHIWLSADYKHGLTGRSRKKQPDLFRAQIRYRFF